MKNLIFLFLPFFLHFSAVFAQINLIPNAEIAYIKTKMGSQINSPHFEGQPIVSPDGKYLFIYRSGHPQNVNYTANKKDEDIWFAELQRNGTFGEVKNMGRPLNSAGNDAVIGISGDGNTLFLYDQYSTSLGGVKSLAISERTATGGWSTPKSIQIKDFAWTDDVAWMYMSADKKILMIAYTDWTTKKGFGQQDLYVSFRQADGTFGTPKNLGRKLNTSAIEASPFLAADNVTMYFATNGRAGYGNLDIFVSKRLDDTWTNWSEPQNLGNQINTAFWDSEFCLTAEGKTGYMSSGGVNYGENADIFKVEVKESARPEAVGMVFGKIINKKTNEPIAAEIAYADLTTGKNIGTAQSSFDGSYQMFLPKNKNYSYTAEKEGFFALSETLDLNNLQTYTKIEKNIYLVPIETGVAIQLNNLFFVRAQATLLPESEGELERLLDMMQKYPKIKIEIVGHTDNTGNAFKNKELSLQRANKVKEFLIGKGITNDRIRSKGMGGAQPLADNKTEETRKLNRRVEFVILEK